MFLSHICSTIKSDGLTWFNKTNYLPPTQYGISPHFLLFFISRGIMAGIIYVYRIFANRVPGWILPHCRTLVRDLEGRREAELLLLRQLKACVWAASASFQSHQASSSKSGPKTLLGMPRGQNYLPNHTKILLAFLYSPSLMITQRSLLAAT